MLVAVGYGIFKTFRFQSGEDRRIAQAFKDRSIPSRSLPPDFRFIDHETTLQEVLDRVGPATCTTQRPMSGTATDSATVPTGLGLSGIITSDFEMPYRAAVVIMPEHPFEPSSRVRAIYYRPPRRDEE